MRAVNLIPKDVRRRGVVGAASRSHVLLGVLAAVLIATAAVVLTNNKISDRKADVARLQAEEQTAKAKADALQPFANFASIEQLRTATVKSLAESRFDWQRVLNELARVMPKDVWLTKLTGTATPDTQVEDGAGISTRGSIAGPALEIVGCAPGQESVARLVAALEDIDGVTRVGVQSAKLPDTVAGQAAAGGGAAGQDCRTRDFISQFELVVAFDAAPVASATGATGATPAAPAPAGGQQAEAASVQKAKAKTQKATNLTPGG